MRSLCRENRFSVILKLELITITKISHLDSLERETEGNSEMAYYDWLKKTPISLAKLLSDSFLSDSVLSHS